MAVHEADLPGALKNPDRPIPGLPGMPPAEAAAPPAAQAAPAVATGEIGAANDQQLVIGERRHQRERGRRHVTRVGVQASRISAPAGRLGAGRREK
jgi:hypothetical protein